MLAYARAGELQRERVALDRVMAEVDRRPARRASRRPARRSRSAPLPEVDGDARQLRRVLQNLVGNAVKFRGEAPPRVEVSALRGSEELGGDRARQRRSASIPSTPGRIFGMFSRLNGDTEGTGIGLAVCRRVVEAHGGRIWVEPAEGGGSAFRFTLPAAP